MSSSWVLSFHSVDPGSEFKHKEMFLTDMLTVSLSGFMGKESFLMACNFPTNHSTSVVKTHQQMWLRSVLKALTSVVKSNFGNCWLESHLCFRYPDSKERWLKESLRYQPTIEKKNKYSVNHQPLSAIINFKVMSIEPDNI